jgi:hypothetical protein
LLTRAVISDAARADELAVVWHVLVSGSVLAHVDLKVWRVLSAGGQDRSDSSKPPMIGW